MEVEKEKGMVVGTVRGMTYADLKAEGIRAGLILKISDELEKELLNKQPQNSSRKSPVVYYADLFLPDSGNRALADQSEMVHSEAQKFKGRFRLNGSGIGSFHEYYDLILQNWNEGIKLLERGRYLYLSARTRTRVFPENVGPQNYVVDIGPLDSDGLCVHILSRDEKDPEIGVWPLFRPA